MSDWPDDALTVADLKAWLAKLPPSADQDVVTLMIEHDKQYHFSMNDMARSPRGYVILMHEKRDELERQP